VLRSGNTNYQGKFCLFYAGESSVGKSSIVTRYATDTFVEGRDATIGGNFLCMLATLHFTYSDQPHYSCVPDQGVFHGRS